MLALVCGRGQLPAAIAAECSVPPLICALDGFAPADVTPDVTFRLETLADFIADLIARGISDVCFCGAITRVPLDPALVTETNRPVLAQLAAAMQHGDDHALRAVVSVFESRGLTIRAAQDLAPGLLAKTGVLTQSAPSDAVQRDADKGFALLRALGQFDVGQTCVMGGGQVLGIEALGGTNHLLSTLPDVPQTASAILCKAPKSGQDHRIDWPTVGPDTIAALVQAGLSGLVLEDGGALMLDRDQMIQAADVAGLFIWVRPAAR